MRFIYALLCLLKHLEAEALKYDGQKKPVVIPGFTATESAYAAAYAEDFGLIVYPSECEYPVITLAGIEFLIKHDANRPQWLQ